jgi:release factor glutamine methyltransferase
VLKAKIDSRSLHVPLAYVRGKTEFYGRMFIITPAVLEPRPESETMIDVLKNVVTNLTTPLGNKKDSKTLRTSHAEARSIRIADVGCGSGALGITAQIELPNCAVELLEIDAAAIEVAKSNVVFHTLDTNVVKSDLLRSAHKNYDILLCNLPYIPDDFRINTAALHEPKLAIFGGADGLNLYRQLFSDMQNLQRMPLYILTEALPLQHLELAEIASKNDYNLLLRDDFIQLFRREK